MPAVLSPEVLPNAEVAGLNLGEPIACSFARRDIDEGLGIQCDKANFGDDVLVEFVGLDVDSEKHDGAVHLIQEGHIEVQRGGEAIRGEVIPVVELPAKSQVALDALQGLTPVAVVLDALLPVLLGLSRVLGRFADHVEAKEEISSDRLRRVFQAISRVVRRDVRRQMFKCFVICRDAKETGSRSAFVAEADGKPCRAGAVRDSKVGVQLQIDGVEKALKLRGRNEEIGFTVASLGRIDVVTVKFDPLGK